MKTRQETVWLEKFWAKVDKRTDIECWEWQGFRLPKGYGSMSVYGKTYLTHRIAYTDYYGEIPHGMHVCHKCDNPSCCNPLHLFLGTNADNVADMVKKGRQQRGVKHHNSKLTEADAENIRTLYANKDISQAEIGRLYNVSQTTVGQIILRKLWK